MYLIRSADRKAKPQNKERRSAMKKFAFIIFALVLVFAIAVPALAQTTGVEVVGGGGSPPIIKCKWETPDDGDPTHTTPGTQVLPPVVYQGQSEVKFWAVVTDPEGVGTVKSVYADVWHPAGPPECGSFKYQLELTKVDKFAVGIPAFQEAYEQGLITFGQDYDYADVMHQLEQCLCDVYMGVQYLSYHQPAGAYMVAVKAYDIPGNPSIPLVNYLDYVPVTAMEIDFENVDYGSLQVCTNKWIGGDTTFGTAEYPTVRNIGNTNLRIGVWQDDMGLGDTSGVWNVEYDARLGAQGMEAVYDPFQEGVVLEDILPLCNTQKLDFSIHIKKADPGTYSGVIELVALEAEFIGCDSTPSP
jgi:hypothetical protein